MELNKIYNEDCLETMKRMADKSVDLVLTDPPFNAGREYANDEMGEKEYIDFTDKWLSECKRIAKDVVVIIGVKYQKPIVMWLFNNMNYCWEFVWWKSNGMLNGKATFAKYDKVLWFSNDEGTHYRTNIVPTDVWNVPIRVEANNFGHSTPKNIEGISKIVKLLTKENDIIFDPFLGSGTTAVACKMLKRNYIGSEISPEYCKIAEDRLRQETLF
jgi:site-specific DNA-methyltransferase (adenine-specific)